MSAMIAIQLSGTDLCQILDGLDARASQWETLAAQLRNESFQADDLQLPASDDAKECDEIATHYRDILRSIEHQFGRAQAMPRGSARAD